MLKDRESLYRAIKRYCKKLITNTEATNEYAQKLLEEYDIPLIVSLDILTLTETMEGKSDYILFCIAKVIGVDVNYYFTQEEIEVYSNSKMNIKKIKFPLKFNVIKVTEDQFVGRISVKELMQLKDAQLIRYNKDTQRAMKRIVNGETEYYRISINKNQVQNIMASYENGNYIPDTITLNMPEDTEFAYDDSTCTLKIKELDTFDITDGYHRYLAMSNVMNINPDFDYTMEIRITCFSTAKASQFIWQEDQKTKMSKVDSDSYNVSNPSNQIVTMLSSSTYSDVINRNGNVDSALFAKAIDLVYFSGNKRSRPSRKVIVNVKNEILNKLNDLDPSVFDNKWNFEYMVCVLICNADRVDKIYKYVKEKYGKMGIFSITVNRIRKADKEVQ